jgi:ribonuclease HII
LFRFSAPISSQRLDATRLTPTAPEEKGCARVSFRPKVAPVPARAFKPPDFCFELELLHRGFTAIAGVDEAGRGPLAGPVVAAAVVFPAEWILGGLPEDLREINDSKQLPAPMREALYAALISRPEICFGIAWVDAPLIDRINILQATHRAMNLALAKLSPPPQHALVDGLRVKTLEFPQTPIVAGDTLSYSIAAASILAKVTRDRLMVEFDGAYPGYGFSGHKGYGTPEHLAALKERGPCPIHRHSFAPLRLAQADLFPE